ncbi:MAG: hypothetical protein H7230_03900 [Candidatus Parcubacteria bacterium]|nr:hypothetical protein [Candidatus Paceibacterota bacterium]
MNQDPNPQTNLDQPAIIPTVVAQPEFQEAVIVAPAQVFQPIQSIQPTAKPPKKKLDIQKNWLVNYTTIALSIALIVLMLGMGGWVIYLYINSSNLQTTTANAVASESQQKILRERLQDAYERQSALNDDMVILQDRSLQVTTKYQSQLLKNFRVLQGKPEAIQGQNIEDMRNAEENLSTVLNDIDIQINTNAKKKEQLKQEIDTLYKQAQEEQARRLNIRDGLRQ